MTNNSIFINDFSHIEQSSVVLKSVVEAEILHVVEFDGLQLLAVQ